MFIKHDILVQRFQIISNLYLQFSHLKGLFCSDLLKTKWHPGPAEPGGRGQQGGHGLPKVIQNQYSDGLPSVKASEGILVLPPKHFHLPPALTPIGWWLLTCLKFIANSSITHNFVHHCLRSTSPMCLNQRLGQKPEIALSTMTIWKLL